MSTRFLLDTNIVSHLVRSPRGVAAKRVAEIGEQHICTSVIVAAELRYGAAKKGSLRLTTQLDLVLAALDVLPLDAPADRIYGDLRTTLERRGCLIGPNDLLLASQALALGCTLVTDNTEEFARVEGLPLDNWIRG